MKVRVVLSVYVDEAQWRAEYDRPDASIAEIREDVRRSIEQAASNEGGVFPPGILRDVSLDRGER
jgi:hypothetical protein